MNTFTSSPAGNLTANIRALREYRGLTQGYMAGRLDISQNGYSKMERGNSNLTVTRLFEIVAILEVDVRDLFALSDRELIDKISKNIWPANL